MVATRILFLVLLCGGAALGQLVDKDFAPTVTATCKAGHMTIKVVTSQNYVGTVHARDFRTSNCMAVGNGTTTTSLELNLLAAKGARDYCGVLVNNKADERSVPIAVRIHKTLELADDKFYVITCGKAGFKNARNETALVNLALIDRDRPVYEAVYGHTYTLRASISRPDGSYGINVKSCFAFNKQNKTELIDDQGCPLPGGVISRFRYNENLGVADATLYSMFRFQDSNEIHFQCDLAVCKGACPEPKCDGQSKALTDESAEQNGGLLASTNVFVLEPGQPSIAALCDGIHPSWLLWLCVAFGVLFLIMLIINIFLCSAMSCACARTEIIEKDPSIIEEYDPYRTWQDSHYGSRYSLNAKPGYMSGGSTMNSTRSVSTNSDHYAIVHSRPGSRYSGHQNRAGSAMGSHYSGK
ncbi:uncharacterized protein LOC135934437 [Cloeon dipterum]